VPRSKPLSLFLLVLALGACSSFHVSPDAQARFKPRAETLEKADVRVAAVVLSREEAGASFGVPLYDKGVQPIWLDIENKGEQTLWFLPYSIDPDYFAPLEVAYLFRFGRLRSAQREMESYFLGNQMPIQIPPGARRSGFVFTNLDEGAKMFNVEITSGDGTLRSFTFYTDVPGLKGDYRRVKFEALYRKDQIADHDEAALRHVLEELPRCTSDAAGRKDGDPLNLVLIGDEEELYRAFARGRWDETEVVHPWSAWKTFASFLFGGRYRYSPVSELYVFGRRQDAALQKARGSIHERNHLRLWLTPHRVAGKPVWIGQISRDIGVRFTWKTITTHKIDPDVDEARSYLVQNLLYSESLAKFAFAKGVGASPAAKPRFNLTGDPYFTDGYRAVLWLSGDPVAASDVVYIDWESPEPR
jgi:hypothetical protein